MSTPAQDLCFNITGHCWYDRPSWRTISMSQSLDSPGQRECRHCHYRERELIVRSWVEMVPVPEDTIRMEGGPGPGYGTT
jgi:hypothetical protein